MAEEYSRVLARVVAAQLAAHRGFEAAHESSLEILAEVMLRYLSQLCTSSHMYATQAGRTEVNIMDALLALEDMGTSVEELQKYVDQEREQVPFAHSIASYPVCKPPRVRPPSFATRNEDPPPHIPSTLPAFPDQHTFVHTPAFLEHEQDPKKQRLALMRARQQERQTLVKLNQRMALMGPCATQQQQAALAANPFLAPAVLEEAVGDGDEEDEFNGSMWGEIEGRKDQAVEKGREEQGQGEGSKDMKRRKTDGATLEENIALFDPAPASTAFKATLQAPSNEQDPQPDSEGGWTTGTLKWADPQPSRETNSILTFTIGPGNVLRDRCLAFASQKDPPDAYEKPATANGGVRPSGGHRRSKKSKEEEAERKMEQLLSAGHNAMDVNVDDWA